MLNYSTPDPGPRTPGCGGFEPEKLAKAEFLWDNVAEVVRKIRELDDYFNE